jgi:mono/diheme cytochrome c family protein
MSAKNTNELLPTTQRRPARMHGSPFRVMFSLLALLFCMALADGSWLQKVPPNDRTRENPYAGQAAAIAGGAFLFADHCAKCHGADALGRGKHPSLRSERVQVQATPGDLFWLLKNGNLRRGMPTWSAMPEPSRWQIIAYLKSLGPASGPTSAANSSQEKSK